MGLILVYILNPFISHLLFKANETLIIYLGIIIFINFIFDVITSFNIISKIELTINEIRKDYTDEINNIVKSILLQNLFLLNA